MISLCPHCDTEQLVTAIALQENKGSLRCRACGDEFKPRAHRVTPARERAFKRREQEMREQQVREQQALLHGLREASSEANAGASRDSNGEASGAAAQGPGNAGAGREAFEATEAKTPATQPVESADLDSLADRIMQRIGASMEHLGASLGERLGMSLQQSLGSALPDIESREEPTPGATRLEDNELTTSRSSEKGDSEMKDDNNRPDAANADVTAKLEKARQTIARQKLLLDYQKLQNEQSKLEMEKKTMELERVKLEILRKHNLLENNRLKPAEVSSPQRMVDGQPLVEYDVRADVLPRTPTAIERDPRRVVPREHRDGVAEPGVQQESKVRLELMPTEPKRMIRRNIGTRWNKLKK